MATSYNPRAVLQSQIIKAIQCCLDIFVFIDKREAWQWLTSRTGQTSLRDMTIYQLQDAIKGLRLLYANQPAKKSHKILVYTLLDILVKKQMYASKEIASADFLATWGTTVEGLTYVQAEKAIESLVEMGRLITQQIVNPLP